MKFINQMKNNITKLRENNINSFQCLMMALQHIFAMFGATVLVPALTGLDPSVALFTSGLGTLVFHIITKGKVPAYLGSSFAFIAPIIAARAKAGVGGAMVGIITAGIIYILMAALIKLIGPKFFKKLLPPVVVGPVIITIGLGLAPVAKDYASEHLLTALVTLVITIIFSVFARGIFKVIPVLMGIIGGYIFASTQGLVDFTQVRDAALISVPHFTFPDFSGSLQAISLIAPIALVTMVEHLGDVLALGSTTKEDYVTEPGLHRTLLGDGIATALAGLLGGPPNTTYGENIGVLAITRIYNPLIIELTAIMVLAFSFIEKIGAVIRTIPQAVMGGIVFLLFGMIASIGLRTLIENKVNFSDNRNLVIVSVILVVGISNLTITIGRFEFAGMGLAALVGIILNLLLNILPELLNPEYKKQVIKNEINELGYETN
ncbi:uracil-xanthine permease family protein [Halothermothrix orenii]|uniref:Uracil-xanthine permease n=1 Tax=Halothermothrix orenii (strain H 168 / OCM 544 / DSM 9562) TaxID=373903 RepID=B8CWM3_HALOH|nr:solute carrier family 23 protein [Halothermothrix orenii]ACL69692.1 uracil-xanthine permease [Halothermothrix orenii H 168]